MFNTKWITIHDTAVDGNAPFNANLAAKAATVNGTPFKRPENGAFRPDGKFEEFYFDETGDTDATSVENDCCGGWDLGVQAHAGRPVVEHGQAAALLQGRPGARRASTTSPS